MEKLFKKVKEVFPKSVIQYEKNYVSFTFGGGLYYQLRVQKDKVRMMATNYPAKAKLGECLKIIKKENIEGRKINDKEIVFEVGVRNPEIFTLRLEMPYEGNQLNDESFLNVVVDSSAKFHEAILPVVNNFLKQPAGDLYSLMGGSSPLNSGSSNSVNSTKTAKEVSAVQKDEEKKKQNKKIEKEDEAKQRRIKDDNTSKDIKLNDKSNKYKSQILTSTFVIRIGDKVNASMFKETANLSFWLGNFKEKIVKEIFYSEENEKYLVLTADKNGKKIDYWDMEEVNTQLSDNYQFECADVISAELEEESIEEDDKNSNGFESSELEENAFDLADFDLKDDLGINYICKKIKTGKYLTNLLYVNQCLASKEYSVDNHQAYYFDSNVLISDRELAGFLVVNMDGFYSNCMNEDEMVPIFSWSGVHDIEYSENKEGSSIDLIADNGRLTIRKEGSNSLKILYTFYQHVWKPIDEKFKNESTIFWNEVWDMGIQEIGFKNPEDYFTFHLGNTNVDDDENIEDENDDVVAENEAIDDVEEDGYEELEEDSNEEDEVVNQVNEDPYSYNVDLHDYGFVNKKTYKSSFDRFLMINENTGILNNRYTREPNDKERNDLWDITRIFCERIYQLDKDVNADQHEINVLSHFNVVSLNWCFIPQTDSRFTYSNGRFRRDTLALALCIFSRISRDYKKYDYLKNRWIIPHIKFSYLMWSLRSIIDANEDIIFYKYSVQDAKNALDTFAKIDRANQNKGQSGYVEFENLTDSNPLKKFGNELTRLLKNNLIPYQFILNYIWAKPKESFFKKLLGSANPKTSTERVRLLDSDLEKNKEYLIAQVKHKEFPDNWTFANDLVFVYCYFAKITDGLLSEDEKETIIEKLSEWLNEEDAKGIEKIKTYQKFKLGFAEFERDSHIERFRFALENIRRHFYIHFDGNEQKILAQLRNVMKDLYVIAESDSGKNEYAISDEERALLDEIDELWGTAS